MCLCMKPHLGNYLHMCLPVCVCPRKYCTSTARNKSMSISQICNELIKSRLFAFRAWPANGQLGLMQCNAIIGNILLPLMICEFAWDKGK